MSRENELSIAAIAKTMAALVIVVAAVALGLWWMYGTIREIDQRRDVRRVLIPPTSPVPPQPRLQVQPQEDFGTYKREQDQILNSYGWISRGEGRVRIPVERAMDLLLEEKKQ